MQFDGRVYGFAMVIFVLGLLVGCKAKPPPPPAQMVSVMQLDAQSVHLTRSYVGRLEALTSADLRPRSTGYITGFFFQEGDAVRAGQLLFRVDTRLYRLRTAAAKAQLTRSEADIRKSQALFEQARDRARRYAPLAATRAIPEEQYTDARFEARIQEANLAQARAERQLAQSNLEQATFEQSYGAVRAPISGIAGARRVGIGDLASASDPAPLVTISQSDPVRVRVSISDADYLQYVAPAARAPRGRSIDWKLLLADGSTYPLAGRMVTTSRAADPQTGTLELVLLFPNPGDRLRPGQYAKVSAELEQHDNVLVVPVTSVRISQGSKTVSVLDPNDVVEQRTIEAEERMGNSYVVTKGLNAGDKVIVGGEQKVKPGDHVRPQAAAAESGDQNPP